MYVCIYICGNATSATSSLQKCKRRSNVAVLAFIQDETNLRFVIVERCVKHKIPSFGMAGGKATHCKRCKGQDMIDVKNQL